jgi:hypothetical protein
MGILVLVVETPTADSVKWVCERVGQLQDGQKVSVVYIKGVPDGRKKREAAAYKHLQERLASMGADVVGLDDWYASDNEVEDFGVTMILCVGRYGYAQEIARKANIPVLTSPSASPEF